MFQCACCDLFNLHPYVLSLSRTDVAVVGNQLRLYDHHRANVEIVCLEEVYHRMSVVEDPRAITLPQMRAGRMPSMGNDNNCHKQGPGHRLAVDYVANTRHQPKNWRCALSRRFVVGTCPMPNDWCVCYSPCDHALHPMRRHKDYRSRRWVLPARDKKV